MTCAEAIERLKPGLGMRLLVAVQGFDRGFRLTHTAAHLLGWLEGEPYKSQPFVVDIRCDGSIVRCHVTGIDVSHEYGFVVLGAMLIDQRREQWREWRKPDWCKVGF
jgi:hypothetical protein